MQDTDRIKQALAQIASPQEPEQYKGKMALKVLSAEAGAPGQDAKRKELCDALANGLGDAKSYSAAARSTLARSLGEIGGAESIGTLINAINDLDVREAARFALDRIPGPEATKALVEAAKRLVGDRFCIGLANSLGQRSGEGITEALGELAKHPNREVRLAAVEAASYHPNAAMDGVITGVLANDADPLSAQEVGRLMKARLRLGANLADSKMANEAKTVLEAILANKPPKAQEKAAKIILEKLG